MKKEEAVFFPLVRSMVKEQRETGNVVMPVESVPGAVHMLETEHEDEGARMNEMAELTNGFTPPAQACATWQYTYERLAEFEKDLHLHIYLENHILFPGASKLASTQQVEAPSCSIR
jgi:regulator of cell morphogenesis and NO signaling